MKSGIILVLAILAVGLGQAKADEVRELTLSLCYARQASGACGDLGFGMQLDTEAKVAVRLGAEIDGDESLRGFCLEGLSQAFDDFEALRNAEGGSSQLAEMRFCLQAWSDYGCAGTKTPGLLFHRDVHCQYE